MVADEFDAAPALAPVRRTKRRRRAARDARGRTHVGLEELDGLLARHRTVVFTTFRRDGRPQMSLVTVGRVGEALGFTTRQRNAKFHNLMRDPRCALMLASPDWRGYAVIDGDAEVVGAHNADADTVRLTLRGRLSRERGQGASRLGRLRPRHGRPAAGSGTAPPGTHVHVGARLACCPRRPPRGLSRSRGVPCPGRR